MSDEKSVSEDQVRDEHLKAVNVPAHWTYLFAVLGVSLVLMLLLISMLGGGG